MQITTFISQLSKNKTIAKAHLVDVFVMPFLSRNVSYSKYCVKHCWHLPLWLLDVCLIHDAFLSAINRLREFDMNGHTQQTTGDNTITLVLYVTHTHTHTLSVLTGHSVSHHSLLLWHFLSFGQARKSIWSHRGPRTTNTERPQNNRARSQTLPVWPSMRKDRQIVIFATWKCSSAVSYINVFI